MRKPFPYRPLGHQAIREYRGASKASNPATPVEQATPVETPTTPPAETPTTPPAETPTTPPAETPTTLKQQTTLERRRAAFERALQQDTTAQRQVARVILEKKNPGGYIDKSPAVLLKQVQNEKTWKAECEAQGFDPAKVKPPGRETLARMIGRRED